MQRSASEDKEKNDESNERKMKVPICTGNITHTDPHAYIIY